MILTQLEQLEDYKKDDILYVVETPHVEIHDCRYNFNLSATLNTYYPIIEIQKQQEVGIKFEQISSDKKTSYLYEMDDINQDLRDYEKYHTHKFIIGDNEREVLSAWKNSIFNFFETIKRTNAMSERFMKDFDTAPFIVEHREEFPEDWV